MTALLEIYVIDISFQTNACTVDACTLRSPRGHMVNQQADILLNHQELTSHVVWKEDKKCSQFEEKI